MATVYVSPYGLLLKLRASGLERLTDVTEHAKFDPTTKCYVLRPSDLPELVTAAVAQGVGLVPDPSLGPFLREQAEALRTQQAYVDGLPAKLYDFQRKGAAFLHGNPHAFLFDDMGLGKTVQSLVAVPAGGACLVVCPAGLRLNWAAECAKWRPDLDPVVIRPGNSFAYPKPGQCVIVGYTGTPDKPDKHGKPAPGTVMIADEAHLVKNYGSSKSPVKRTRRFRLLARRITKAKGFVWMMSGTPVLKNPKELWGLLQAQQLGPRLYGKFSKFAKLCGGFTDGLGVTHWSPGGVHEDAMEPLRPYVLRRKKTEVLKDMPPKTRHYREVELLDPDTLLDDAHGEYAELLEEAALAAGESLEYFGGIDMLAKARKQLATAKIPALLDIVEEHRQAGEPLVVFSAHKAPVEALEKLKGWASIRGGITEKKRAAAVADFQAGRLSGLACTIRAAGMGLTLTHAASAVFVDQDWTPAMNRQAEDRLARIGQKRPVTITVLRADHKLDQQLARTLASKLAMIDQTTEKLNDDGRDIQRIETARKLDAIAELVECAS